MSRPLRETGAGLINHVVANSIPSRNAFPDSASRHDFLQRMIAFHLEHNVHVYAYAMMTSHVHLLLRSGEEDGVPSFLQRLLCSYAQARNRAAGTMGPLWRNRYRSVCIREHAHLVRACLYIDANPWRADVVSHPSLSDWTSYRIHVRGANNVPGIGSLEQLAADSGDESIDYRNYDLLMERYLRASAKQKSLESIPKGSDPLASVAIDLAG